MLGLKLGWNLVVVGGSGGVSATSSVVAIIYGTHTVVAGAVVVVSLAHKFVIDVVIVFYIVFKGLKLGWNVVVFKIIWNTLLAAFLRSAIRFGNLFKVSLGV